ncbi:MAG: hypothetical protein O3A55_07485, partial [Bacteroidetes bacterium]|nr:hypothetical protein [Bacteroidota bacterium]
KTNFINLFVTFEPKSGIHINTEPPIELLLESDLKIKKIQLKKTKEDYLDFSSPVKFRIKPKTNNFKKDSLFAKLQYYYCSDSEGWCNRFTQEISIKINISKLAK